MSEGCGYCSGTGETVLWQGEDCRVILADEPGYPGWCRVVWKEHVAELSDLAPRQRRHLMDVVAAVERIVRSKMSPAKMNLASLGTQMPHLHWHIVPRQLTDPTYPSPVWAEPDASRARPRNESDLADQLRSALNAELGQGRSLPFR